MALYRYYWKVINMDKKQYQKEQDELLTTILEQRYFLPWQNIEALDGGQRLQEDSNIEIYLTAACNQKCEYCYLHKHPEIYPRDKMDPSLLLHNLSIFYDWLINNNYHIKRLDFFSGDIWQTQFGLDVLQLTYDYTLKGLQYDDILIASNCSFIDDPIHTQRIQKYINLFSMAGKRLAFSISIDGKIIDNFDRPRKNSTNVYTDKFYELLFSFAKHNNYGFHPMVSSHNIHLWQKNLNWWKEMTDKYQMRFDTSVMMLEVRNDEWTDETIKLYCEFIQTLAEDFLIHECHNDIKMFGNITGDIRIEPLDNTLPLLQGYYPWCFGEIDTFIGCTISNQFAVRIGDLAICPCHRTAYDKYLYGHFKVEDDKIVGITARNPQMAIQILMGNIMTAWPKCDTCLYNSVCMHGCLGSQLEAMRDPFVPIPSVCKLFKAKYSTIINWYKQKGVVDYWKSIDPDEYHSDELAWKLNFIDMWEREQNGMGES